jgi:hypothetical protein
MDCNECFKHFNYIRECLNRCTHSICIRRWRDLFYFHEISDWNCKRLHCCGKAQDSVTPNNKITTQLQLTSCLLHCKPKSGRYTCTFAVLTTMWIHCLRTHGSLPTPPTTTQTTNHHQPPTNTNSAVRKLYIHLSSGGRGKENQLLQPQPSCLRVSPRLKGLKVLRCGMYPICVLGHC